MHEFFLSEGGESGIVNENLGMGHHKWDSRLPPSPKHLNDDIEDYDDAAAAADDDGAEEEENDNDENFKYNGHWIGIIYI